MQRSTEEEESLARPQGVSREPYSVKLHAASPSASSVPSPEQERSIPISQPQVPSFPAVSTMSNTQLPPPPPPPSSTATSTATSHAQAVVGAAAAMSGASSSSQFQRLKVEDALSYLDQVKLQFGNQPQVYNDFLDIMKEFKSQSIDTPGVISRVSNLFRGHPDLIVGFNTFLPPGFKIEVRHNEINISGPAQHERALQKIAAQHNSSVFASNQASGGGDQSLAPSITMTTSSSQPSRSTSTPSHPPQNTAGTTSTGNTPHQPVEFNHAISYVNKIKNRFQHHPDIYKAFLEILHTYQKEQRVLKDGGTPTCIPLTETEVYSQVSKLFQNQEDLLKEFGQFLPDATSQFAQLGPPPVKKQAVSAGAKAKPTRKSSQSGAAATSGQGKKTKSTAKDALAEAGKHTNYSELALFDKIRKALRNQEVYDNFLRCLILFNEEIISRQELIHLVTPFLGKFPDLFMSLKVLLGFREPGLSEQLTAAAMAAVYMPKERVTADLAAEIDFNSLKRQGASYRALPKTYVQPKCSGRTMLCREVLNDTWVSFPMWSEDSTFQGTRKTQFEEYIFRCEDERFELDIVLDTNLSTIRIFEALQKKMARMSPEDLSQFNLFDSLGGRSDVLQRKAIHRIYGDKAPDIIEGLKKSPSVAMPIVLKRLKSKQEEWLEAQRAFNKTWRDQLEKYYLKSLDYQGINFKALDTRAMRSKSLISEIECIFDERQEQLAENGTVSGPHLSFSFPGEQRVFADAVGLVMYYLKRASTMQREDAIKIRSFLTHTLADFCFYDRVEVGVEDDLSPDSGSEGMEIDDPPPPRGAQEPPANISGALLPDVMSKFRMMDYHLMITNNSVYTFFRLLQLLCERLNRVYHQAVLSIHEETEASRGERGRERKETNMAVKLGLKKMPDIQVDEYYPTFLNMAKNLMEGNIDSTTYEDTCREMFGVHAFVVFTIDRLVQNTVRQLHSMLSDDGYHMMEQFSCFVEQLSPLHCSFETRLPLENSYQRKMENILADENCFKIKFHKTGSKMTIELMDTDTSSDDINPCTSTEVQRWLNYIQEYSKTEEDMSLPELNEVLAKRKKLFLRRNRRIWPKVNPPQDAFGHVDEAKMIHANLPHMEIHGSIQFKLDKNAYRMIPLANSEDYLYNRGILSRLRETNVRSATLKSSKFWSWHERTWRSVTMSAQDAAACELWLTGMESQTGTKDQATRITTENCFGRKRRRYVTTAIPLSSDE